MTTQALLWTIAGAAFVLAVVAAFAEHRRARRRDLDRVGWMPWNFLQLLAFLAFIVAAAMALRA